MTDTIGSDTQVIHALQKMREAIESLEELQTALAQAKSDIQYEEKLYLELAILRKFYEDHQDDTFGAAAVKRLQRQLDHAISEAAFLDE